MIRRYEVSAGIPSSTTSHMIWTVLPEASPGTVTLAADDDPPSISTSPFHVPNSGMTHHLKAISSLSGSDEDEASRLFLAEVQEIVSKTE